MYTHFNTYAAKYLTDVKIYEENFTLTPTKISNSMFFACYCILEVLLDKKNRAIMRYFLQRKIMLTVKASILPQCLFEKHSCYQMKNFLDLVKFLF